MNVYNYSSKGSEKNPTGNSVNASNLNHTREIKAYNHPLFGNVRMFVNNGKPWFCATDIATSLGYSNPRKAIIDHCKSNGVTIRDVIDSMGRNQQMKFISEGNIYRLTAKSQMPKADEFESWIFDDVVPSVVNTGRYSVQPQTPQTYLEALKALVSSEEEKERLAQEKKQLEEKNAKLQPKAAFADCIMQSNDCISVGEMANILKQNGLFKRGRNALYEWMRWNGYLLSRGARYNLPSQKSMSLGIMKIAESIQSVREQVFINRKAIITPHGQKFFIKTFSKGKSLGQGTIRFTYQ